MVSLRDRALIEAKARGIDITESLKKPWKQMLHLDIIGSAFGISVFLMFYYTAVGFFVIYFETLHGFTLSQANSLGNWFWAFDAAVLIIVGVISDRVGVRKPFMVVGAIGAIAMLIVFLNLGVSTTYATFAVVISIMAAFLAVAYAPWMASFTETVEKHNPALTATGLAVWGWIIRVVIAVSIGILPTVVSSMTPIVQYGAQVKAIDAQYGTGLAAIQTLQKVDPATLAALQKNPADPAAGLKAVGDVSTALHVSSATAIADLQAAQKIPPADLAFMQAHANDVVNASASAPGQWKDWWWVCVGGMVLFLPFILVMAGRWSPKKAREDAAEHAKAVEAELAALQQEQSEEAPS